MIPLQTTTVSVWRTPTPDDEDEPLDPADEQPARGVVVEGLRAHISSPSGREAVTSGGEREVVEFRLNADPFDLHHDDLVVDESTGERYEVTWAHQRQGLGLDHVVAGLRMVSGVDLFGEGS